jgi:hypothetical protein
VIRTPWLNFTRLSIAPRQGSASPDQLTRNGASDDNGPEFSITPPRYPVVYTVTDLARVIARATACGEEAVLRGMAAGAVIAGAGHAERQRLDLPD